MSLSYGSFSPHFRGLMHHRRVWANESRPQGLTLFGAERSDFRESDSSSCAANACPEWAVCSQFPLSGQLFHCRDPLVSTYAASVTIAALGTKSRQQFWIEPVLTPIGCFGDVDADEQLVRPCLKFCNVTIWTQCSTVWERPNTDRWTRLTLQLWNTPQFHLSH